MSRVGAFSFGLSYGERQRERERERAGRDFKKKNVLLWERQGEGEGQESIGGKD